MNLKLSCLKKTFNNLSPLPKMDRWVLVPRRNFEPFLYVTRRYMQAEHAASCRVIHNSSEPTEVDENIAKLQRL